MSGEVFMDYTAGLPSRDGYYWYNLLGAWHVAYVWYEGTEFRYSVVGEKWDSAVTGDDNIFWGPRIDEPDFTRSIALTREERLSSRLAVAAPILAALATSRLYPSEEDALELADRLIAANIRRG